MRKISYIVILTALSLVACKDAKKQEPVIEDVFETEMETLEIKELTISLNAKSDSGVSGEVTFTEEGGEVHMHAMIKGLTPGEHAIHLHESSDCSAADGSSAGGHWNPTNQPHGKWGAEAGYHKGDIGNFTADADGNGMVMFSTDEWCIGCDDANKNIIGKSVIVHAGTDDYTTQPTGDAGGRVSCAGIIE